MDYPQKVWIELKREKVLFNLHVIKNAISPLKVMAVVKANAYGMGLEQTTKLLLEGGIENFGVTSVDAASKIKKLAKRVYILGGLVPKEISYVVQEGFIAPINDIEGARLLSQEAVKQKKIATCQFKIDTGMGRIGIREQEAVSIIEEVKKLPALNIDGIYSHFPAADSDPEFSSEQVKIFTSLLEKLSAKGISFPEVHIANSDGVQFIAESTKAPFTMVRTGISLYGPSHEEPRNPLALKPAFELKSCLAAVRDLPAGTSIGYSRTHKLKKASKVGTVTIGYSEGLPMALSEKGYLIIKGKKCPVIGRVSMNLTTVLLDSVPEAKCGDEVVCIGEDNWITELAKLKNTIPYDIMCSLSGRISRKTT